MCEPPAAFIVKWQILLSLYLKYLFMYANALQLLASLLTWILTQTVYNSYIQNKFVYFDRHGTGWVRVESLNRETTTGNAKVNRVTNFISYRFAV